MDKKNKGKLIVAGLDIGNKKDIPQRTLDALISADFIVAEHAKLMESHLSRLNIKYSSPMYNYLPDLEDREERISFICNKIENGETVLLISSEGMPLIHDPGYEIVNRVRKLNLPITVIPGPSAPIAALAMSGIDSWRFSFESDVPINKEERLSSFSNIINTNKTFIYFEKDWQLLESLKDLGSMVGYKRPIAICINMTMDDEFIFRGSVEEAISYFTANPRISDIEEQNKIVLVVAHYNEGPN